MNLLSYSFFGNLPHKEQGISWITVVQLHRENPLFTMVPRALLPSKHHPLTTQNYCIAEKKKFKEEEKEKNNEYTKR